VTSTARALTVYDMIARAAALHGARPAVIQGERQWTFAELRARVDALATGLAGLGIAKGDRICILAQNDVAYLELYGACARQGLVAYPINWRLTGEEVERVVERAAPRLMVVDASTLAVVEGWPQRKRAVAHWYRFGETAGGGFQAFATLYREGAQAPAAEVAADDTFAVISTAAVDVIPRGAALTHANIVAANLTAMAAFGTTADDRYLLALPLFHVTALGTALVHLHAGAASVLVSRYDPEEAVRLIDRHRVTHVSDFPPVLATLLDAAEKAGSRLASLRDVAGLDAPPTIQRLHEKTGAAFWTGFGQSETTGFVSIQRVRDKPGAAGRPVPAAQIRLVDEYDREVPAGTPGEIVVRGPLVFEGYFAQPDVTAYTLRNGWHHTGDVGRFDADGWLYYVKRKPEKELIKPGGENVYPAEVENVIFGHPAVAEVAVIGVPDEKWGEVGKAFVICRPGTGLNRHELREFLLPRLAKYKIPVHVEVVHDLPRTASGKIQKAVLRRGPE